MPVVTACVWRRAGDDRWQAGTIEFPEDATEDPDGAAHLFQLLVDRSPEAFQRWAEVSTKSRLTWRPFVTFSPPAR